MTRIVIGGIVDYQMSLHNQSKPANPFAWLHQLLVEIGPFRMHRTRRPLRVHGLRGANTMYVQRSGTGGECDYRNIDVTR